MAGDSKFNRKTPEFILVQPKICNSTNVVKFRLRLIYKRLHLKAIRSHYFDKIYLLAYASPLKLLLFYIFKYEGEGNAASVYTDLLKENKIHTCYQPQDHLINYLIIFN